MGHSHSWAMVRQERMGGNWCIDWVCSCGAKRTEWKRV